MLQVYFCSHYSTANSRKFGHKNCPLKCNSCFCKPACAKIISTKCKDCNRTFVSTECFAKHLVHGICALFKICPDGFVPYNTKDEDSHKCGTTYCKICKDTVSIRHDCYIAITKLKPKRKHGDLYVTMILNQHKQKKMGNDATKYKHEVVLCVAQQACDKCRSVSDVNLACEKCGQREHIFFGENVIHNFMIYLGNINEKFTRIIILAHNSQNSFP